MANDQISILPKWADIFDSKRGDDIPADLVGAKIVKIGAPIGCKEQPEGGGLRLAEPGDVEADVLFSHKDSLGAA